MVCLFMRWTPRTWNAWSLSKSEERVNYKSTIRWSSALLPIKRWRQTAQASDSLVKTTSRPSKPRICARCVPTRKVLWSLSTILSFCPINRRASKSINNRYKSDLSSLLVTNPTQWLQSTPDSKAYNLKIQPIKPGRIKSFGCEKIPMPSRSTAKTTPSSCKSKISWWIRQRASLAYPPQ